MLEVRQRVAYQSGCRPVQPTLKVLAPHQDGLDGPHVIRDQLHLARSSGLRESLLGPGALGVDNVVCGGPLCSLVSR